jgi:hypothetical protein
MAEKMELEYEVSVTGLGETAITAETAGKSADQASLALTGARSSASRTLPIMLMSVRSINAARLAVEQTTKAIADMDLRAAMYGFLNMMQVVRNLSSLMIMLKESTGAASAAQAILATLTGNWWLIPLALTAGALIYAKIKSMQTGGLVPETGPYLLHKGEKVIPSREVETLRTVERERIIPTVEIQKTIETRRIYSTRTESISPRTIQSFGPIFVTFERQPREGLDMDSWLRNLGPKIVEQARRG